MNQFKNLHDIISGADGMIDKFCTVLNQFTP